MKQSKKIDTTIDDQRATLERTATINENVYALTKKQTKKNSKKRKNKRMFYDCRSK